MSTPLAAVAPRIETGIVRWRLLGGPPPDRGAECLQDHVARLGPAPDGGPWLLDMLDGAALRGRGGAGFPAGRKWRSVAAAAHGRGTHIVVNVAEGEPASHKDRTLAALRPHLILDGAALAAATLGAGAATLYVGRAHRQAREALRHAIKERWRAHTRECRWGVVEAPDRYVAGESSAVINLLTGGPAKPTMTPPRPHESGILGRPTLIQNAETIAHAALIARLGVDWYRQAGTENSPGTALLTVGGGVVLAGVLEVDRAATLGQVIDAAGGLSGKAQAVLLGGYFGTWLPAAEAWDLRLDDDRLREHGTSLGCGLVLVLPASSCGVTESARILRYLADESAGQCGPCVYGLDSIASALERIASGGSDRDELTRLQRWAGQVALRGACHHPDGAVRLLDSALRTFSTDIAHHLSGRVCAGVDAGTTLPPVPRARGWR